MADTSSRDPRGVYIFHRFERFWHWTQAALILFLMATGAEMHGYWTWLGFERALEWHIVVAFALMVLWAFAIFWHLVAGEWRHYVPTTKGLWKVTSFYVTGFFFGEPHPFRPSTTRKHNPLQAMAYLSFKVIMAPALWTSGLVLWAYSRYPDVYPAALPIMWVNALHVAGAFLIAAFLIAHLYLITTGETVFAQLRAMITGWDRHAEEKDD